MSWCDSVHPHRMSRISNNKPGCDGWITIYGSCAYDFNPTYLLTSSGAKQKMKAWWKSPLFSWGSLFGIPCQDDFLFLLQSMGWETEMLCPCCYPNAEGARIFGKKRKRKLCLQKRTALLLSAFVKVGWERGSKWWVVGWFFFSFWAFLFLAGGCFVPTPQEQIYYFTLLLLRAFVCANKFSFKNTADSTK